MKKTTNQYCLDLLNLGVRHNKALVNLIMALSSQKVGSVVCLSESPLFHYQYSSITDAVSHMATDDAGLRVLERRLLKNCLGHCEALAAPICLATDKTVVPKPQTPTFPNRTLVACPNPAFAGARSLSVGYEYSWVNLHLGEGWSLPLSAERIELERTAAQVAGRQVSRLLSDEELPFKNAPLIINDLDGGYGGVGYLEAVKQHLNLVSVISLRHGSRVWEAAAAGSHKSKVYGRQHYLLAADRVLLCKKHPKNGLPYEVPQAALAGHKTPDEDTAWEETLKNGRRVCFRVRRFNDLLWRTVDGVAMKDRPFDVALIEVRDALTGEPVFKRPLFLGIFGDKRAQLQTPQIPKTYRKRYHIEPFFRFAKQNMAMCGFQTPVAQHLDNWMYVILAACWVLFYAARCLKNQPKKWQRYLEGQAQNEPVQSLAQAQKAALNYLLTFDQTPFLPQKSKPGPGRKKGQRQPQRTKHRYVRKNAKISQKPKIRSD